MRMKPITQILKLKYSPVSFSSHPEPSLALSIVLLSIFPAAQLPQLTVLLHSGRASEGAVQSVFLFSTMKHFTTAGCTLAVLVVVMLAREAQAGQTITLGGSYGWTNKADIDYDKYLSNYKVKIGDTLEFVNYDSTDHTVVEVDKEGYESCGDSGEKGSSMTVSPGISFTVTFKQSGDLYAICDVPGHCLKGQKVYVQVLNSDGTVNSTTTTPTPGKSSAAPEMPGFSWTSQLIVVVVASFSLMVAAATM